MGNVFSDEGDRVNVIHGSDGKVLGFTKKEVGTKVGKGKAVREVAVQMVTRFDDRAESLSKYAKQVGASIQLMRLLNSGVGGAVDSVPCADHSPEEWRDAHEKFIRKLGEMAEKITKAEERKTMLEQAVARGSVSATLVEAIRILEVAIGDTSGWQSPEPHVTVKIETEIVKQKTGQPQTRVTRVLFEREERSL